MFGLCDCDSFFASCERIFRPDLYGKPVVVLSNNDGCIVALTKEAKSIGLQRGQSYFQIKDIAKKHDVTVFSSNYTLYGDISSRIISLLYEHMGNVDVYSIDEAFFEIEGDYDNMRKRLVSMRSAIWKGIGVPVSIGIAPTYTLAKIASHFAKKVSGYKGVCFINTDEKREKALALTPIEDVWGIGRRYNRKLQEYGITNALQFTQFSESWVDNLMGIQGVRTWKELRGIACKTIEETSEKKSICTSRSFSNMVSDIQQLSESIAEFTSKSALKLRRQKSACNSITVFIMTNRFRDDLPQYFNSHTVSMPVATNSTSELIHYAFKALNIIYREGYQYKKSGVILSDICPETAIQQQLFDTVDRQKQQRLTKTLDEINQKYGESAVHLAVQNKTENKDWKLRREHKSPDYTTNINEIITVKAGNKTDK